MLFKRCDISSYGNELTARANQGMGEVSNIRVQAIATDANLTLGISDIAGGAVMFTGFTAGRTVTTPTAAQIAAAPDMDIGDSFSFTISVIPAFAGTFAAGAGVTLAGRTAVPASGNVYVVVTKTGAAAFTWTAL